ncbi:MAG: hypothetical protein JW699_08760 [Chitinispirillaceae bacterium]|nr:hypothetical protein [Chitinispirillaceae bacterium]
MHTTGTLPVALCLLLVTVISTAEAGTPPEGRQAQFIAGVFLLLLQPDLPTPEKHRAYRELELLTGIDGSAAAYLLAGYRTKPAEWQRLSDSIAVLLSAIQPRPASPKQPEAFKALPSQRR